MKKMKWLRPIALVAAGALLVAACGGDDDSASDTTTAGGGETTTSAGGSGGDRGNVDGILKLGALLPQSGDLQAIYESLQQPIDMAVKEINDAGGVNGKPVEIVNADDGTSADVAKTSLDTLLTGDKVDAIVGPAASGTALGILDKVKTAGVLACSGSTTSAELTTADDGGYFFRTAPPDKFQGPALAQVIVGDGKSNVAVLARNDSYGTGFAEALSTALTDGGAAVAINAAYDPAAADFKSDVAKVKDAGPDAIALIAFPDEGAKVLKEMVAQGIGPDAIQIYVTDGLQSSSLAEGVDPANTGVLEGVKGTAPAAAPSGVTSPFNDAWKATGVDPIFSSYFYDCTIVTALASLAATSDDPAAIKDKMAEVTAAGTKCNTFADCAELIANGEDIDYDGASGPLDFSDVGEPTSGVYDVWAFDAEGATGNVDTPQISIADEGVSG